MLFELELYLFCIAILIILCIKIKNVKKEFYFIVMCVTVIAVFSVSVVTEWLELTNYPVTVTQRKLINAIYFGLSGIPSLIWVLHVLIFQKAPLVRSKLNVFLISLPCIILTILSFASCKWNIIFWIDDNAVYHRGNFFFYHVIVTYGYIVAISIRTLIRSCDKKHFSKRQENISFTTYAVLLLIFGVLQILFYGIPLSCIGITASILLVFINMQELKVSKDYLTKLNNRNTMLDYLASKLNKGVAENSLALFVVDIDFFKHINDKFGHTEGDIVLMTVANALKKVCPISNSFVSRFGGDEFIIISEIEHENHAHEIRECIYSSVENENNENKKPYTIQVSVGYALYDDSLYSIPDFIAAADANMYEVKKDHHTQKK